MRYFGFLLLIICFSSCQFLDKKKVNAEDLLNEELKTFNWSDVDQYPSFTNCSSSSTKIERKNCFETTLTSHINSILSEALIVVTEAINDTVIMEFQISEFGDLSVKHIRSNISIKTQIPKIDSLLKISIQNVPEIFPAIKRGQHVKTEFKLPIVIQAN